MRNRYISTALATLVAGTFVMSNAAELLVSPAAVASDVADGFSHSLEMVASSDEDLSFVDAKANREGRYLGFDTYAYPGDEVMRAWRDKSVPYEWVGYYLPAPCHSGTTWMGKRERLADMGWGMAVIYVGQQTWDKTPTGYETHYRSTQKTQYVSKRVKVYRTVNGKRVARYVTKRVAVKRTVRIPVKVRVDASTSSIDDCNAQLVGAPRGVMEAADAIARTEAEGFPRGSVIFLDIEYMTAVPKKMREYYSAWTAAVLADGRYRPGAYVHTRNAATIFKDMKEVYDSAGVATDPPFWISGGDDFSPDKEPTDVGHAFAAMWQGVLNIVEEWNGHSVSLDVNVSDVRDPSLPVVPQPVAIPVDRTRVDDGAPVVTPAATPVTK